MLRVSLLQALATEKAPEIPETPEETEKTGGTEDTEPAMPTKPTTVHFPDTFEDGSQCGSDG
ncbi:hypothetical protein BGZ65_010316, partial [Modicella reniformis]